MSSHLKIEGSCSNLFNSEKSISWFLTKLVNEMGAESLNDPVIFFREEPWHKFSGYVPLDDGYCVLDANIFSKNTTEFIIEIYLKDGLDVGILLNFIENDLPAKKGFRIDDISREY